MNKEIRILILEDSATDAELAEHELRKANIQLTSKRVETKKAFLKELTDFTPDLIFSDYTMPSFDGITALRIAQEKCPSTPFIFVSGTLGEEVAIESLKIGATDYVLKNRLSRLVPVVQRALREAEERIKQKHAEEQLLYNAFHDVLTGLANRALLMDHLGQSIRRVTRRKDYLFALLFLDIDRFKIINDSLGHIVGDQLLIEVARRLEACLRSNDTVARFGGDEFTILLDDINDISDAIRVANRIHDVLALPINLEGHEVFTTASVGIALSATGYDQPEEIIRDADTAMNRAKTLGKGRYEVFDRSMHTRAASLLEFETDLRRAVERQEFQVNYQPIVSLETGWITGFEALVRWRHPERGILPPAEFLPAAEETGLISPIDKWVLHQACRQTHAWQGEFRQNPPLSVHVNLSSKRLNQPNLVEQIDQVLQETGLDERSLNLEIMENVIMENRECITAILLRLRCLGVRFSVDDFGTGYSSLSYLHRLPFDTLKIDQSFVCGMGVDSESSKIVETMTTLAHNLGMNVTAEGIETPGQLTQLRALKCKHGQGYHFCRPVDSAAARALIEAQPRW